ncbi:peptidase [Cupriavidus pauculus]|uniref:Peptidase n=2 Tax=Cupriavidus pauculus TaxID=82633 RepID=A0A2N5C704_9BURK|nr:peptidase [Cupriavidus pauculus]
MQPPARRRRLAQFALLGMSLCAIGAVAWASLRLGVPRWVYNPSDSVASGWYRVDSSEKAVRKASPGSLVLAWPPADAAALAAGRGYLPAGVPLLKRVGAVGPHFVCVIAALVFIDGRPVASLLGADRHARALPSWRDCRCLRPDEVYLLNVSSPSSFDSRYFGPVPISALIGVAHPMRSGR